MAKEHKYIKREGTRGNYKYIYEDDLKNAKNYYNAHPEAMNNPFDGAKGVGGFTKALGSAFKQTAKGALPTAKAMGVRKDIKNVGRKLVMGANGAVEKVKDAAGSDLADKAYNGAAKATEKVLNNAGNVFSPKKITNAAKKQFNNAVDKAFDKAETEYAKKEKDGTFDKLNKTLTSKAMSKLTGVMEGAVKNEMGKLTKKSRPPKAEAAETRKSSVKSVENDKATITGADYLKKAADKGLTKGDEFYDQFAEAGDIKIVGDKDKIKKLDNYWNRQITGYSLAKKANALRKEADDALAKSYDHRDEFDKKCTELESKGAPMTKVDMRNYLKDKRFKDLVRLEADGEAVTDEQMYEGLSDDPYENIPTEMLKDFDNLLEETYTVAEKEHAARHAEYMANIMDIQNEKNYQKEMKDIEEDDFEWYQNGKRLTGDGEVSADHKVKEKY